MIALSNDELDVLTKKVQQYFNTELDQDIGQFPARFLIEFFTEEIGPHFYNRGLYDAQSVLESRIDSVTEAIQELEKSTESP